MIELRRFRELSLSEHGRPWHDLVARNSSVLKWRYMGGVAVRYGLDEGDSTRRFDAAIREDDNANQTDGITRFVAINTEPEPLAAGALVGAVTLYRGLPLRSMNLAVPPAIARSPLAASLLTTDQALHRGTNVSGWTDTATSPDRHIVDSDALAEAYDAALPHMRVGELPWTIEPTHQYTAYARVALEMAGYTKRGVPRRYDVGESPREIPPMSLLYVHAPVSEAA